MFPPTGSCLCVEFSEVGSRNSLQTSHLRSLLRTFFLRSLLRNVSLRSLSSCLGPPAPLTAAEVDRRTESRPSHRTSCTRTDLHNEGKSNRNKAFISWTPSIFIEYIGCITCIFSLNKKGVHLLRFLHSAWLDYFLKSFCCYTEGVDPASYSRKRIWTFL